MDTKLVEIIRRRERLLVQAEAQRGELAGIARRCQTPIAVIDRSVLAARMLKAHPLLLVAPLAALAAWRPRQIAAWAGRAWMAWRFWRSSPLVKWLRHAE